VSRRRSPDPEQSLAWGGGQVTAAWVERHKSNGELFILEAAWLSPPHLHSLQLENSGAQSTHPELKQKRSKPLCKKESRRAALDNQGVQR